MPVWVDGFVNFYFFTSTKNSLLPRGSNVQYINPLGEVRAGAKSPRDRSGGEPLPDVGRFFVKPCRFLVRRQICWLWLNLTAWNSQKTIANYVATVCIRFFFISNFIFSSEELIKVFYFEGLIETRGEWSCMMSFSLGRTIWRTIRSFTVLSKSCIFLVNMNLNKTILQSTYLIFLFSLLFAIVNLKLLLKPR